MNQGLFHRGLAWAKANPIWPVLLLALALRLVHLGGRSFQYDDVFSIFLARRSLPEIVTGTAADTMPPLFYFLLHFWMVLGQSVWWIRLLSVITGLGIVWVFTLLVERWVGRSAAVWAGVLAAISPLQIYHAQDVRMYALLVLGQIGYAWFFTRIWFAYHEGSHPRRVDWAGLIIFGLVATYSHNLAVFALLAADFFLFLRRELRLLGRLILAQVVIALGSLPWMLLLPGQLEKINRAFWTPRPGLLEIVQSIILFHAAIPLPAVLMAIVTLLSFWVLALTVLEVLRRGRGEAGAGFLACLFLLPPVLLFIVSYLMRPVFVTRGFLVSSLGYYGLVGYAISRAWQRGGGKLIAGAFILAAVLSLPAQYYFNDFPRSPYQQAVTYLETAFDPASSRIIHETKLSFFPAAFYAPGLPQVFLADEPGSPNDTFALPSQQAMQLFPQPDLSAAAGESRDIYFITYEQVFDEYAALGENTPPNIRWLEERFTLAGRESFNDLLVYHYVR